MSHIFGSSITEKKGDAAVGQPFYANLRPAILSSELRQDGESNEDRVCLFLFELAGLETDGL